MVEWWLTAGAVFQNIWNAVDGRSPGYGINDYDLFYFDDSDLSWEGEDRVISSAATLFEDLPTTIEVRNEARVHLWYEERFGTPAEPFSSAADAIDSFASTTCSVGVTRGRDGLHVYAPYGLDDVFAMHMRPTVASRLARCTRRRFVSIGSDGRRPPTTLGDAPDPGVGHAQ